MTTPSIVEVQQLVVTGAYTLEIFMPVATIYPDLPDLATVAITGSYNDLIDLPDAEVLADVAYSGQYGDLLGLPVFGTAAYVPVTDFATAAQGAKADTALQPGEAWNASTTLYNFGGVVKTDGATLNSVSNATALDMSGKPIKRLTLNENTTITLSNLTAGQDVLVRITQGATPGTAAWSGVTKWDGGAAPVLGTSVGDVDDILLSVELDGTTVLGKLVASYS